MLVPAKVNGVEQLMLVDTGGVVSELSERTADTLNLDRRQAQTTQFGVWGQSMDVIGRAHSFSLGNLHTKSVDFIISKNPAGGNHAFNGVIAPSLLKHYDVELDFAGRRLTLLSPNHCAGQVIFWPASTLAVIPIHVTKSGHIVLPVELDGIRTRAIIDTGMTFSTLSLPAAQRDFAVMPGSAETPDVGHLPDNPGARIYRHRFKRLDLGGIVFRDPEFMIIPDLIRNTSREARHPTGHPDDKNEPTKLPSMLIGMDMLHHLHLYIAYREGRLYVTPANLLSASR